MSVLRIRRHRADVFILGDCAREAIGRRHGARAERLLAAPAESLVAGMTDSARPLRPRLRWARSLRDRASGRRWCGPLNCRKGAPLHLLPVISILKRRQPFDFDVGERLRTAEAPFIFLPAHRISDDEYATGLLRFLRRRRHGPLAVDLGLKLLE